MSILVTDGPTARSASSVEENSPSAGKTARTSGGALTRGDGLARVGFTVLVVEGTLEGFPCVLLICCADTGAIVAIIKHPKKSPRRPPRSILQPWFPSRLH
jgi:hypothetical protein